nr:hypothetical protein [Lachnospiraceae bacterium]
GKEKAKKAEAAAGKAAGNPLDELEEPAKEKKINLGALFKKGKVAAKKRKERVNRLFGVDPVQYQAEKKAKEAKKLKNLFGVNPAEYQAEKKAKEAKRLKNLFGEDPKEYLARRKKAKKDDIELDDL